MELGQQIMDRFGAFSMEVKSISESVKSSLAEHSARILELEQNMVANRRGGGDYRPKSLGSEVVASDQVKSLMQNGGRGMARLLVSKSITSASNSGGALTSPDFRLEVIARPRRKLTMRSIMNVAETTQNSVRHVRQLTRTNAATFVAEGALKPESGMTFENVDGPVRTLATWVAASRQISEDAPQLQAFLDNDLRYAIGEVEETAVLFGDGLDENLHGLWHQATAYDTALNAVGDTPVDTILKAIGQAERRSVRLSARRVSPLPRSSSTRRTGRA